MIKPMPSPTRYRFSYCSPIGSCYREYGAACSNSDAYRSYSDMYRSRNRNSHTLPAPLLSSVRSLAPSYSPTRSTVGSMPLNSISALSWQRYDARRKLGHIPGTATGRSVVSCGLAHVVGGHFGNQPNKTWRHAPLEPALNMSGRTVGIGLGYRALTCRLSSRRYSLSACARRWEWGLVSRKFDRGMNSSVALLTGSGLTFWDGHAASGPRLSTADQAIQAHLHYTTVGQAST